MRVFCLIRFPLTQVAHFGNDKKASEELLGNHTDRPVAAGQRKLPYGNSSGVSSHGRRLGNPQPTPA